MGDKTWTVVGTSVKKGEKKLRLANGTAEARRKVLEKDDHTEVRLFDLPRPMTASEAEAWLNEQGDAVPTRNVVPKVVVPKVVVNNKRVERAAIKLVATATELAHEELGQQAHAASNMAFLKWDQLSSICRAEFCRNAAWKAGIPCPKGTFPELEHELMEMEGVEFGPLGERT
jgi:hypothetical protein